MRRFLHPVLLLVVFGLGLSAGAWFSISRRASDFAAGVEQRLAESSDFTPAPIAQSERGFPSDEEMLTALMSAVAEDEPLLRAHRLHDLLSRLNSSELAVFFTRAARVEDRERRGTVLGALLERWVALDPTAAATAVRPHLDRFRAGGQNDWRSVETTVDEAWAQAQPDLALAEAMATPDAPWSQSTAWAALQSLAGGNPMRQLEALQRQPPSRLREQICESAIKALAEKDSAAAEAQLNLLPDPRQRARVQSEILGKLAERDPAAGLARLASLTPELTPGATGTQLVTGVLRAAAKKDAAGALAAVEGLPEELRSPALGAALVGWAGEHPVDALTWAAANGVDPAEAKAFEFFGDSGGASWNSLVSTAFQNDRAKTLAWLRGQPVSRERDRMLREGLWIGSTEEKLAIFSELTLSARADTAGEVAKSLRREGDARAVAWVKDLPSGAVRTAAVVNLTFAQAGNAPERIDSLAEAWPAGPERDAALRGIAFSISNGPNPQRALDFARRIANPTQRESTTEQTVRSWLHSDEPAARAWVTSTPDLSVEQKRVLLRQFEERQW